MMQGYYERMNRVMDHRLVMEHQKVQQLALRLKYASPMQRVREQRQRLLELEDGIRHRMQMALQRRQHQMAMYIERMKSASPLEKLAQGYAAVTGDDGNRVFSVDQVSEGEILNVYVADGRIQTKVMDTQPMKHQDF